MAVNVSRNAQHDSTNSQQHAAATHPSALQTLPASQAVSPAASGMIDSLTMPFDVGWLPAGDVQVDTGSRELTIDVAQMPGTLAESAFKSGPGRPITVNGRAGLESTNAGTGAGYEVYFTDARGRLMYVNVLPQVGTTVPTRELTTVGRHVAESVHYPGTHQVRPSFGLGYVPRGLQVRAFTVQNAATARTLGNVGAATQYDVGTAATLNSSFTATTAAWSTVPGAPGRPVQGHPTRWSEQDGYVSCYVLDAVHGNPVQISGRLSRAEIFKIADGLQLPTR